MFKEDNKRDNNKCILNHEAPSPLISKYAQWQTNRRGLLNVNRVYILKRIGTHPSVLYLHITIYTIHVYSKVHIDIYLSQYNGYKCIESSNAPGRSPFFPSAPFTLCRSTIFALFSKKCAQVEEKKKKKKKNESRALAREK